MADAASARASVRSISAASRLTMASPRPRPLRWCASQRALALHLVELVEDARQAGLGDADAAVPDLQQQLLPPRARAAADQHAAVVGVADGVADQVAQDALEQHRVGVRDMAARRGSDSIRPFSKAVGSKCSRSRANSSRMRTGAGLTSTPPVSMRVMSSSSPNSPSSASTDSLMLFTSDATSGSWLRWRSASANSPIACSGWRRSWLAAAKNCVFARLAASAARRALFGLAPSRRAAAPPASSVRDFSRIAWSSALRCRCGPSAAARRTAASRCRPAASATAGWCRWRCARSAGTSTRQMKPMNTRCCVASSCTEATQ